MPAFHSEGYGPVHLPNPVAASNGEGYKAAIYEDFPIYDGAYPSTVPHEMSSAYTGQPDRYGPLSNHMYGHNNAGFPADDWYPDHHCLHPMNAPMIAPLRVGERYVPAHHDFSHAHGLAALPEPTYPKEEKATGGVSAKLDYDMEQMTDFVAESAVAMYALSNSPICVADIDLLRSIKPGHSVQAAFRKWVLQVLNATRLPSATILLSLSYLAIRVRQLSTDRSLQVSERTFYKMVTVALILGSKFLDDNTFQNKSWAEVSNIAVTELNYDEREWLTAFGHRLHHDPHRVDGFEAAQEQWKTYQLKTIRLPALQPLDTNLRRHRSMQALSSNYYSPQRNKSNFTVDPALMDHSYQPYNQYDPWYGNGYRSAIEQSPLSSASHSGPHTPEYINGWGSINHFAHRTGYPYPPPGAFPPHPPAVDYQLPPFRPSCVSNWSTHGAACQCQSCRQRHPLQSRMGPALMA